MNTWGRNNIIGYCLSSSSKQEVRIGGLFSPTSTLITGSGYGRDSNVNMAIADSQGNSISVNCHSLGEFAIAMDGTLRDQDVLYQQILESNQVLLSKSSEELMAYLLAKEVASNKSLSDTIRNVLDKYPGGYSVIVMNKERIFAARDCYGVKPLIIGRLEDLNEVIEYDLENDHPQMSQKTPNVIASSSVVLENVGAKYIRQVLPGELVELGPGGVKSLGISYRKSGDSSAMCALEYVIMEPASSFLQEQRVQNVRYRLGEVLATEAGVKSDCVISLPNISLGYLLGYSQQSGLPIVEAFYYSLSTTEPKQLSLYNENVSDLEVTLVIDSTINQDLTAAVYLLKNSSATKIHVRVCSPAIEAPCPFGIEVAVQCSNLQDVDSVAYLSLESLERTIRRNIPDHEVKNIGHCLSCFGKGHGLCHF